jgi:hypothetical protein
MTPEEAATNTAFAVPLSVLDASDLDTLAKLGDDAVAAAAAA